MEKRKIFSVTQLNQTVRQTLSESFNPIWLEGEISNLSQPSSGHMYFSLKDDASQVRCALFRNKKRMMDLSPKDGMQVIVYARVELYTPRGEFQLIIETIDLIGKGELKQQFEILKNKLAKEGLFDEDRKSAIPAFPQAVGIITSSQGAALRDILKILRKRFPPLQIIIYPTLVQGAEAINTISQALETAEKRNEVDVLIIARGGGSLEDLHAFNHEKIVRLVAASTIPVISGIGHEIDFSLCDFAADYRAPTPTAAAIKSCPSVNEIKENIAWMQKQILKTISHRFNLEHKHIKLLEIRLGRYHPSSSIEHFMQHLDELFEQLVSALNNKHIQYQMRLLSANAKLKRNIPLSKIEKLRLHTLNKKYQMNTLMRQLLLDKRDVINALSVRLKSLNVAVLKRGFSITTDENNKIIHNSQHLSPNQKISIRFEKGSIKAIVKQVNST